MREKIKKTIPKFGLYGEDARNIQPEFVHIEKISERSRANDWKIEPHRHGKMYQVLVMYGGEVDVSIDETRHQLKGNWAICIPPGTVHGFRFPANTKGEVLTMMDDLIKPDDLQLQYYIEPLLDSFQLIQFKSSDALFKQMTQYLSLIRGEIAATENGHTLMLNYLVKMVFMTLKRQLENSSLSDQKASNSKQQILNLFRQKLEENYSQHWSSQQYAQALNTSTSSLNRVCQEHLGLTAKTVIQNRLLIEIKRRLIYTREPLDSIAYTLGYKDPSYFSRFFKKHEGISPREYREKKYHETETSRY